MICDCRRPNAFHKRPPKTKLGGPDSLVEIDLSAEALEHSGLGAVGDLEVTEATADVKDSFFQYSIKEPAS
eukprot:9054004-Karenia_brevis.AAC.1